MPRISLLAPSLNLQQNHSKQTGEPTPGGVGVAEAMGRARQWAGLTTCWMPD